MNYRYTVKATFQSADVAQEWVLWLKSGHCEDVLKSGAAQVELVALDSEDKAFEVRYIFVSREAFLDYEEKHAVRLRREGLELFPVQRGISYFRSTGALLFESP
jgi:hypothetical protein